MKKLLSILKLLVVLFVIGFLVWFFAVSPTLTFKGYEETLKDAAVRYFQLNNNELPTGERVKTLSLNALYKKSYLKEDFIVPRTNKMCSIENSWVKVKRDKNGEYQYYVYLDCGVFKSSIDHEGPEIKLNGKDKIVINLGDKYTDAGVKSVRDKKDGKLNTDVVTIKSNVNTNKIGIYEVKYIAFDSLNNKTTVTRLVEVVNNFRSVVKNSLGEASNFRGDVSNNYVRLSNMYFRIFGLTEDGKNVILVSDEDLANVSHGKIEKWLDDYFYEHLNDFTKDNIIESKFCNMDVDEVNANSMECTRYTGKRKIYIPSSIEINKAQVGEDNFLRPLTLSWLSNKLTDTNEAYVTRDVFFNEENKLKNFVNYEGDMNFGVKPMFVFSGDVLVIKGDGTLKKPYEFGDSKKIKYGVSLAERETGEYVEINGFLYRIIDISDDGLARVIILDSLGDTEVDEILTYPDPKDSKIIYNPKDKKSVGYFINNRVSEFVDTSHFVNHEIEVPIYKDKIIYGEEVETEKYTVKLAAPNMFELFSAQGAHYTDYFDYYSYWMTNCSKTKRIAGAVTDVGVPLNQEIYPYQKFGVRIVAHVNKKRVVVSGKGTYFDPYKIN